MLQPFFLIYFLFLVQNYHLFISCAETDKLGSFEIWFTFISHVFDLDERKYLDMWVTGTEDGIAAKTVIRGFVRSVCRNGRTWLVV